MDEDFGIRMVGPELVAFRLKLPPQAGKDAKPKPQYLVRTENTRWYAEVLASTAEQVEQDLASLFK